MRFIPKRFLILAFLGTAILTFVLSRGCAQGWWLPCFSSYLCGANQFFIEEALNTKVAATILIVCMLPGLGITALLYGINKRDPKHFAQCRAVLRANKDFSFGMLFPLSKAKVLGKATYALLSLFWLFEWLSAKAGTAVTGVVLGVALDLHFFGSKDYALVLGCFGIAYVVALLPQYVYWRATR